MSLIGLHSILRYLVLLAGLVAMSYALVGWARDRTFDRNARLLGAIFTGLLDLQVLLGVLLLVALPFRPILFGHISMMVIALGVAHVATFRSRRLPPSRQALRFQFVGIMIALGLIAAGIMALGIRPV